MIKHQPPSNQAHHGGDVFAAARELDRPWREILDYSANINPLGPPAGLKKHLAGVFDLVHHYPDPFAQGWRSILAERLGLSPGEVLAGNGTTALYYLLARVFRPKRPVVAVPAFAEYEQALKNAGLKARRVPCRDRDNFDLTGRVVDKMFSMQPDMIFLANPTSPAGRLIAPEVMERVLGLARKNKAIVALDEAFIDFTDAPTIAGLVGKWPELIVFRSLTKIYALPGLRLGYLTAAAARQKKLLAAAEPWSVNALALAAGSYCLDRDAYALRTRRMVDRERTWLAGKLTRAGMGRIIPAAANYLLVRLEQPGLSEEDWVGRLKTRGVLVRGCTSFQGILKGYIRLAVKSRAPNRKLVAAVEDVLNETDGG